MPKKRCRKIAFRQGWCFRWFCAPQKSVHLWVVPGFFCREKRVHRLKHHEARKDMKSFPFLPQEFLSIYFWLHNWETQGELGQFLSCPRDFFGRNEGAKDFIPCSVLYEHGVPQKVHTSHDVRGRCQTEKMPFFNLQLHFAADCRYYLLLCKHTLPPAQRRAKRVTREKLTFWKCVYDLLCSRRKSHRTNDTPCEALGTVTLSQNRTSLHPSVAGLTKILNHQLHSAGKIPTDRYWRDNHWTIRYVNATFSTSMSAVGVFTAEADLFAAFQNFRQSAASGCLEDWEGNSPKFCLFLVWNDATQNVIRPTLKNGILGKDCPE